MFIDATVEGDLLALAHDFLLLLAELERHVRGHGVCQTASVLDAGQRRQHLGRHLLVELDVLIELGDHGAAHRLDFVIGTVVVAERRGRRRNPGYHGALAALWIAGGGAEMVARWLP